MTNLNRILAAVAAALALAGCGGGDAEPVDLHYLGLADPLACPADLATFVGPLAPHCMVPGKAGTGA